MPTYPTGLTQLAAVTKVRTRTNEPTLPDNPTIVDLLNEGLDQVVTELGAVLNQTTLVTTAGLISIPLGEDVQDVVRAFWSATTPLTAGWVPYEMVQFDWATFVQYTGGMLNMGGGPSYAFAIQSDTNGLLTMTVAPTTQAGFIFVVYHQRASLWDPNDTNSLVNLDPSYQDLAVWYACARVCESVENISKAKYFDGKYQGGLDAARETIRRRTARHPSTVRDVTSGFGPMPAWWPAS